MLQMKKVINFEIERRCKKIIKGKNLSCAQAAKSKLNKEVMNNKNNERKEKSKIMVPERTVNTRICTCNGHSGDNKCNSCGSGQTHDNRYHK
jgi:hypothetical protein